MSPELSMALLAGLLPCTVGAYIAIGVLPPWWASRSIGEPLGFFDVLRMRFEGVNAWWVVKVMGAAKARSEQLTYEEVADAYLDGVDLRAVYAAMQLTPAGEEPPAPFAVLADRFRYGGPAPKDDEESAEELKEGADQTDENDGENFADKPTDKPSDAPPAK